VAGIYGNAPSGQTFPVVINSNGQLGTGFFGVSSWDGRQGNVVPQLGDYSFSLITGTLASSQLSGSYSNQLMLSNSGNSFSGSFMGNGSQLTGVLPAAGSPNYIQNTQSQQSSASFNIDGNGTLGQTLSAMTVNTATTYQVNGLTVVSTGAQSSQNLFLGNGAGGESGTNNTFSGYTAGDSNTGSYNTFSGNQAGVQNGGNNNTFSGYQAGYSTPGTNNTGSNGTFLGYQAGSHNTMGSANTFTGSGAGSNNSSGNDNTFSGYASGGNNTTGNGNTFYGYGSGTIVGGTEPANYNTFVGYNAGSLNRSGGTGSNNNLYIANLGVSAGESNVIRIGGDLGTGYGPQTAVYIAGIVNNPVGNPANVYISPSGQLEVSGGSLSGSCNSPPNSLALWTAGTTLGCANVIDSGGFLQVDEDFVVGGSFANFSGDVQIVGNLNVEGTISKGGGSFKIDHPLDPGGKYLYHSFVESPDMMDVYNGNVITDKHGQATVILPDYFEALNRDFRYQLTVIGQFAQAIIGEEISHNRFIIRSNKPGVKISWQVTGIRQDAYANAHRIQVEENKPPEEQGHYLHPELFGASKERSLSAQIKH
jgi:hypothetical protein